MEFNLIKKSVSSRNRTQGRFMSPIVTMCSTSSIPISYIGRKLSSTSSRISQTCMRDPLQFYSLLWLLVSKRVTILRTPQARQFLKERIPMIVSTYIDEGSRCMGTKILLEASKGSSDQLVAVLPLENFQGVIDAIAELESFDPQKLDMTRAVLEEDRIGVWLVVLPLYILAPLYMIFLGVAYLMRAEMTELSNFETQGIALGTWVRDKRRD
jgi:pheromone shutdown protein TraB